MCERCFSGKPVRHREVFEDFMYLGNRRLDLEPTNQFDGNPFHGRRDESAYGIGFMRMGLPVRHGHAGSKGRRIDKRHGMTASAYYWQLARWIEDRLLSQCFSIPTAFKKHEIAELMRVDANMLRNRPMLGRKELDHPQTKLSNEDVRAIRVELAHGEDKFVLAEKYGVSRALVWAIGVGDCRTDAGGPLTNFTKQDHSARSKRGVATKWLRWHEEHDEKIKQRIEAVARLRDNGMSWREIERVIGVSYITLSRDHRRAFNLRSMTPREAGMERKRRSGGNQFQPAVTRFRSETKSG